MRNRVLDLLKQGSLQTSYVPFSAEQLYNSAVQLGLNHQLQAIHFRLKPKNSKLKRKYQWNNFRTAVLKDSVDFPDFFDNLISEFSSYAINFGHKYLIVGIFDKTIKGLDLSEETLQQYLDTDFLVDESSFQNETGPNSEARGIQLETLSKKEGSFYSFLMSEKVLNFETITAPPEFLNDTGKLVRDSLKYQRRVVTPTFHRLTVDFDRGLFCALIDRRSALRPLTPSDKLFEILSSLENYLSINLKKLKVYKPIAFFPAIQKIYEDESIGRIVRGYFHTSSGSRFANSSKGNGLDLRVEPFQLGGEAALLETPNFVKLEVHWPKTEGCPLVNLKGSADMLNLPNSSLNSCEVLFSTNKQEPCNFLSPVLHNAYWDEELNE